ncbi:hemerythrin domain-containing protein [Bacillus marasmi]|uniref:hemerythrin domain-containing protein n=1 Tax=Bacillus marasmi TaxID=1926279 RepID=UPI0011C8E6E5|nr:hemerythrin domain-containing protein [Bacillus marasmi]
MVTSKNSLCAPLQQLMAEHVELRANMSRFYEIIEDIEYETGPTVIQLFIKLHKQITTFTDKLKAHSKREEKWLFPMMNFHLGDNDRTIQEMEREHEKAEQHLLDFLTEVNKAGANLDETMVEWITTFAFQAHATLTEHFAKEEKSLFPLAEEILSFDEKKELYRLLQER